MEFLLITKAHFAGYKTLSSKINQSTQLDPYILEAQRLDLLQMIGSNWYHKIITVLKEYSRKSQLMGGAGSISEFGDEFGIELGSSYIPTTEEILFLKLVNGFNYTDSNGYVREYLGLIPVLVYLTFARYVRSAHINSTQTGFQKATLPYSEHISSKEITEMAQNATNDAQAFMTFVFEFIRDHEDSFSSIEGYGKKCLDGSDGFSTERSPVRLRLGAIRGTTQIEKYSNLPYLRGRNRYI